MHFSFVFFAVLLCSLPSALADVMYVTGSQGSIYPGLYLSDCVNVTADSCSGGMAGAAAVLRSIQASGYQPLHSHFFDRFSSFVMTHPRRNAIVMDMAARLGIRYLTVDGSAPSLPEMQADALLKVSTPRVISTNSVIPPNNAWYGKMLPAAVENNIAMLSLVDYQVADYGMDPVEPVWTAVRTVRAQYGTDVVIVLRHAGAAPSEEFVRRLLSGQYTPDVVWFDRDGYPVNDQYKNATKVKNCWLIKNILSDGGFGGIRMDVTNTSPRQVLGIISLQKPYSELSKSDALYVRDLQMFSDEAKVALANDPVIGSTKVAFNYTWSPDGNIRPCFATECETGALFADSLRYMGGADFAVYNSGGIRGPGWPAGNMTASMLFTMNPYSDYLCTGTMLGSKLLTMYNWSIHMATFDEVFNGNWGHMLLQNSHLEVRYNTETRALLSVKIWSEATKQYEPVDPLKVYKYATAQFECEVLLNSFITSPTSVERTYSLNTSLTQQMAVVEYMKVVKVVDYSKIRTERLIRDNTPGLPGIAKWSYAREDCGVDTYYDSDYLSCRPCPPGTGQPTRGSTTCLLVTASDSTNAVAIIVPIVVGLSLILIVVFAYMKYFHSKLKDQTRDVSFAPKDDCANVALMFTDVEKSSDMWNQNKVAMEKAIEVHHRAIRECIQAEQGYEVKTIGDSFMVAHKDPKALLRIAVRVQRALVQAPWPQDILSMEQACIKSSKHPNDGSNVTSFRGLRVRMGLHWGPVNTTYDTVAKGYDYYGDTVNAAARIEGTAFGGQLLVSGDFLKEIPGDMMTQLGVSTINIGEIRYKGIERPISTYEIVVDDLCRVFRGIREGAALSSLNSSVGLGSLLAPVNNSIVVEDLNNDPNKSIETPGGTQWKDIEAMSYVEVRAELVKLRAVMEAKKEGDEMLKS